MEVRVLGAHNLETVVTRHSCFLLDGVVAVDAGSLVGSLTAEEHTQIRQVLLTHRHLDHTRDIPALGLSTLWSPNAIDLHGLPDTLQSVRAHLLNDVMYPDFTRGLNSQEPKYLLHDVAPESCFRAADYDVRPIAVPHTAPAVGYVLRSPSGVSAGFTGDLGGGLAPFFEQGPPLDVLFVECTFPNRFAELAHITGHLTPGDLHRELAVLKQAGVTLPQLVIVHMSFADHKELAAEAVSVSKALGAELRTGFAGMVWNF